jgi:hypothetical protein
MKFRFPALTSALFIGFTISAISQITVTLEDLEYAEGQNYKMYGRTTLYIVQTLTGKIGGPHTWDFSTGPTNINYTFDHVLPSATPCEANFPAAAIAEKRTGDGSAAYLFLDFQSGTGRVNYGACQPGVLDIPYVFNPPIVDFPATINFMDFWDGQSEFAAQSSGIDLTVEYFFTAFCNAYGTLTLPGGLGSFPCLQVNYLEHFKYYWEGMLIQESYIRSFYWLIETAGIAVIIVSEEGSTPPPENFSYSAGYNRMYESSKFIVSNEFSLDVKVFLEGPYNSSTGLMNTSINAGFVPLSQPYNIPPWNYTGTEMVIALPSADIVDWVLVELRDATQASLATGSTRIARQAAFLLKNGNIVGLDGSSQPAFDVPVVNGLFALVWHRNHAGVLSAAAVPGSSGIYSYDFTNAESKAYGGASGHKQISAGVWGVFSGDADADGDISLIDKTGEWNSDAGHVGYISSDFNMNSQVINKDKNDYWLPNVGSGSSVPE